MNYLAFLAEDGWPSLVLLGTTTLALIIAGKPNRKLLAGAPGIFALAVFVLSGYLASISTADDQGAFQYVPIFGLLVTALLVIPSVLALRQKWLGLLHIFTLLGGFYLCFIGVLAISGDAT